MVEPLVGAVLSGRYRLVQPIATGQSGGVWEAHDDVLGRSVAVRELRLGADVPAAVRPGLLRQAAAQARATGRLAHSGIVTVYDVLEDDDRAWIIMQRVVGHSLADDVAADGPWSAPRVARLGLQLADALAAAHATGLVHRDVRPTNVLLADGGGPMLSDLATPQIAAVGAVADLAATHRAAGYAAPELSRRERITVAADFYSLGATLYFALTGRVPSGGSTPWPQPDSPVADVIMSLLADDPAQRLPLYAAVDRLTSVVGAVSAESAEIPESVEAPRPGRLRPTPLPPIEVSQPPPEYPRSRRRTMLVAGSLVAVLAVAGVAFALRHSSAPADSPGTHNAGPQPTVSPAATGPDTMSPQPPSGVKVSGRTTTAITLAWDPAIDDVGVIEYRISRNGTQAGTSPTPGYVDSGLKVDTGYTYTVVAVDAAGNVSLPSAKTAARTLKVPDVRKPTSPARVRVVGRSTTSIALAWNAATDDVGVTDYQVFRDDRRVGSTTRPKFTDEGLTPESTHSYTVRAVDAAGNLSAYSGRASGTTLKTPDTTAPSVPSGLTALRTTTSSVSLRWNPSMDDAGVVDYLVARDALAAVTVDTTSYVDSGLAMGTSYTYSVSARDAAGNVSAPAKLTITTVKPQVVGLTTVAGGGAAPGCQVTVRTTVAVSAGPVTVQLAVTINGASSSTSVVFTGSGPQSRQVDVGTAASGSDGSATVSSTTPNAVDSSADWNAQAGCQPGFTLTDAAASAGDCGTSPVQGSITIAAQHNAGPVAYTVVMNVDGQEAASTTVTVSPHDSQPVALTSATAYAEGTHTVSFTVSGASGSRTAAAGDVTVLACPQQG
ncbi:protein kinase domain-containing protein [Hamadaea tsunoensis]|uniref:protein kinase domain-containing protein n=1 Tax=Hamadaea tsunoensis TaxID=53368 RepID=UPI0004070EFC|nr:protein kinase [Hamadaea tsunoensis]